MNNNPDAEAEKKQEGGGGDGGPNGNTAGALKDVDDAFEKDEHDIEKDLKVAKDVAELYDAIALLEAPLIEGSKSPIN
jgi:hypothetical protein